MGYRSAGGRTCWRELIEQLVKYNSSRATPEHAPRGVGWHYSLKNGQDADGSQEYQVDMGCRRIGYIS